MPVTRIVLLLVVGGGLVLFALSNMLPVLPLVFLGTKTLPLPLAAWMGFAIAAGAGTSFFLQFVSYLQKGYSAQRLKAPNEVSRRTSSFRREEPPETIKSEPQTQYTSPPPPPETPPNRVGSDWEERSSEDWDFREEPPAPTSKTQDFEDWPSESSASSSRDMPPSDRPWSGDEKRSYPEGEGNRTDYEVPQEPKSRSQSGSTYSYSYRETEKKDSGVGKSDVVYDANYRVITPPYQKPPEPSEDEEDWGLEDDEDFNDDVRRNPRR